MSAPAPRQASLRRLREFGIRPNRELGQNFLVDSNILDVIVGLAELREDDVALEIGGGLGVLSEHLAALVAHLHVIEIDRALEPPLRDALAPYRNASLLIGDALRVDLRTLEPAPTQVVANLPYGIATSAILRTIEELEGVRRWVVMVQREVGQRLAAAPGSAAYGIPSVLAQLACDVRVVRPIARSVFSPAPNVDSVLLRLDRRGPAAPPWLRELVQAAFAHRRKPLAGSLALALPASEGDLRTHVRRALGELGLPADTRAERLSAQQFLELGLRLR